MDAMTGNEAPELRNVQSKHIARGNSFLHFITLLWLMAVILFDKNAAYIKIGPIYITEFVLSVMFIQNIRMLKSHDYLLIGVVAFYFFGGVMKGHHPFFAIRDLAWLYYLFFLRLFPRNFPRKYVDIVIYTCWIRVLLIIASPLMNPPMVALFVQKYRDVAVILFFGAYYSLIKPNGRISFMGSLGLGILSFIANYKALMILMFLFPVLLNLRRFLAKWHSRKYMVALASVVIFLIYTGNMGKILNGGINALNVILSTSQVKRQYSLDTAMWRAAIWQHALLKLTTWMDITFGKFPGHNFMNSQYLGVHYGLAGGDKLGTLRSAHNIIVQIVMKTGVFGLLIYGWYYFRTVIRSHPTLSLVRILALLLAMTADILEVPCRGPLLFSLFVILEICFIDPPAVQTDLAVIDTRIKALHNSIGVGSHLGP